MESYIDKDRAIAVVAGKSSTPKKAMTKQKIDPS
jgi:hypothetical protein